MEKGRKEREGRFAASSSMSAALDARDDRPEWPQALEKMESAPEFQPRESGRPISWGRTSLWATSSRHALRGRAIARKICCKSLKRWNLRPDFSVAQTGKRSRTRTSVRPAKRRPAGRLDIPRAPGTGRLPLTLHGVFDVADGLRASPLALSILPSACSDLSPMTLPAASFRRPWPCRPRP